MLQNKSFQAKQCSDQEFFYKQLEGTAMGNPLSPFIAYLFMTGFEMEISKELQYFLGLRYVCDVFAIFDTNESNIDEFVF